MAQFLTFGNYSREGVAGLLDPSAPDRKTVLGAAIEGMGGKLIDYQMTRGIYDFYAISEADSFDQIAAVVMKVFASGAGHNIQTLEVMDLKAVQAIAGGVSYTPPGG